MRGHAQPMPTFSRGFRGRRADVDPARVPPGQYVTRDFPVLSAGPTPRTPLDEWSFTINGAVQEPVSWPWVATLADAVAALNLTERIKGKTIIRIRPYTQQVAESSIGDEADRRLALVGTVRVSP